MERKLLLEISGQARSGKDTFALMFAEELNKVYYPPFVMMAFAHELKLRCMKDFDLSYDQLWGKDKEEFDKRYPKIRGPLPYCCGNRDDGKGLEVLEERQYWTAREIMQEYGQFFREIDNDFWVKHLFKVIEEKEYKNVIITDARHINEVDAVCNNGGYHIRVQRDSKTAIHGTEHISETALNDEYRVDFLVQNSGTLDDLQDTAKKVARFLIANEKRTKKLNLEGIDHGK